jgi:hypothetical protein
MTTLGRREKCLRNRSEKGHFRALRAHQMRNRPLPAPLETPWTKPRLNPCQGMPFALHDELESKTKMEIPAKNNG